MGFRSRKVYSRLNWDDLDLNTDRYISVARSRILAQYNLSLMAYRIFYTIASLVHPEDIDLAKEKLSVEGEMLYEFNLYAFCKKFGYQQTHNYRQIKDGLMELRSACFEMPGIKNRITGLAERATIENGQVVIKLDPALVPLYYDLKATRYQLANILQFTLPRTFRFYDLFMFRLEDKEHVRFEISLDELKRLLNLENKFEVYGHFKSRVLDPAIADINGNANEENYCNISVSYQEIKMQKKVVALSFSVQRIKEKVQMVEISSFFSSLTPESRTAYTYFEKLEINNKIIETSIKKYGEDVFLKIYSTVKNKQNLENKSGYAVASLRNGWYSDKYLQDNSICENLGNSELKVNSQEKTLDVNKFRMEKITRLSPKNQHILFQLVLKVVDANNVFGGSVLKSATPSTVLINPGCRTLYLKVINDFYEELDEVTDFSF